MDINIVSRADLIMGTDELYIINSALFVFIECEDTIEEDRIIAEKLRNEISKAEKSRC